ncbi:hypothetical protein SAMN05877753_1225 [Bacillus oleivorans]|uniref:Replication protein n=1 Tax=Bacillus oleivorans TaxID=1448271 RepID=A0A285D7Y1_9BACI|nr:hypothetical protein [Bacillus oleivorans]SNX75912.1 hypothetical protein SAMN05877753_1225 [Bacillus oleivorans]
MQGWIKLHRKVFDSELWNDVTTFRLFAYLLLKATHKDGHRINGLELKRGQWVRSYRKLAQDLAYKEGRGLKEYSIKTISKCVNKLVKSGTISIQETEQGTLFTILNYSIYQDETEFEEETGNATGNEEGTNGKRSGNKNKNVKNGKNVKNNKKHIYAEFVSMLPEEYQKLVEQFGEEGAKDRIENLNLYKGSKGVKYKDDYLTILNWERKNKKGGNHNRKDSTAEELAKQYDFGF